MMEVAGITLVVALASAALMGAAIQRGATCMVAAVDEVVSERRHGRALALAEAAAWVGGLVALVQLAGLAMPKIDTYPAGAATTLGGVLLGLGAWINRACVFGAVARIGNGQVAWFGTPVGFFIGSLAPFHDIRGGGPWQPSTLWLGSAAAAFAVFAGWRIAQAVKAPSFTDYVAHPHRATLAIAVTFVSTLLTVGAWAYTDALADLARAMGVMNARLALRGAMVAALLAGALVGGHFAGKRKWQRATPADVLRCLAGGALLGAGAVMVPGSNDGLIMLGLPLLQPHAWISVSVMALTIAAAILIGRTVSRPAEA
jgi:hypothetical protein